MDASPATHKNSMVYPWLVVAILMIAYVFSFVDRQILNLLVGPIRRDLDISDTQMSLLMGYRLRSFIPFSAFRLAASLIAETVAGSLRPVWWSGA